MKWMRKLSNRFLDRRGGTWPRFFRWSAWAVVPFQLLYRVVGEFSSVLQTGHTEFFQKMWVPFAVIGSLWLLSSTAATLAAVEKPAPAELLRIISRTSFAAGMWVIPIATISYGFYGVWQLSSWQVSLGLTVLYLPMLVGNLFAFVDMSNNLDELVRKFYLLLSDGDPLEYEGEDDTNEVTSVQEPTED